MNLFAVSITFIHTGTGTGQIGNVHFDDAYFTITAIGDTEDRQSFDMFMSTGYSIIHRSASISINGLGTYHFITPTRTFVNNTSCVIGLAKAPNKDDLLGGPKNDCLKTWDMSTSIGPVAGQVELMQWYDEPISTSGNTLIFDDEPTTGTFQAIVPEPSTIALLGMGGIGIIAWALRRRKTTRIMVCFIALFVSCAAVARADTFATTINSLGNPAGGLDSVYGWSFIPTTNISVTQLGVFDYNSYYYGPSTGLYDSHPIGIWNSSDPANPLVSTTVPSGTSATLINYIRYEPVTPTLLIAGTEYVIGAYYPNHTPPFYGDFQLVAPYNDVDISTDPHIVFMNRRVLNYASGLKFPSWATTGGVELGPTFQFTIIPEPSTIALLLTASLGGLLWWRRR
jgi:hypothetical protein